MRKDPDRSQPERRSARLAKTKRRIDIGDQPSASQNPGHHFASRSEEEQVVVGQVEVVVTPSPGRSDPVGPEEEVTTVGERVEEELSSEDEDNMPSTTRLKYSRFKGDGSQDVDDWLTEFKSTALANQEELAAKQRIFQGVLKGEALKWYQDVPDRIRDNWEQLTLLFLRTFREAGGEARALGRLSKMTMGTSESVRRYGQRVKALIQKLTTDIAPSVQVEWYVAGFPEEMGFQIRQTRPATLQQAMEAAQNYENSAHSLRKSLRGSEKRDKSKTRHKDRKIRKRSKHFDSSSTSSSNSSSGVNSVTNSSDSDQGTSSGKHGSRNRNLKAKKGKEPVKVKLEDGDQKAFMKNIADALEAIKVNLTDNRKPRRIVPTSRANVWCSRCGDSGHFASECVKGPQRQVHLVDLETGVYYSVPEEELEPETNPVFRVQTTYGRGKGVTQIIRSDAGSRPLQIGISQGLTPQGRYPVGVCWSCGDPTHFANVCPNRGGQGAPLILPCQNCGEYGHQLQ